MKQFFLSQNSGKHNKMSMIRMLYPHSGVPFSFIYKWSTCFVWKSLMRVGCVLLLLVNAGWPVNFAPKVTCCHVLHRDKKAWVTWPQQWEIVRSDWLIDWLTNFSDFRVFFKLNALFMIWFVPKLYWSYKINGLIWIWYIWCKNGF